ncbi:MAG TPA: helix-turn-helix transcriptional regulator [Acidimicrobiia bacterium]|nr:helix-turn-helix transcriptional regulator [Acidimicrobiia bacterium]
MSGPCAGLGGLPKSFLHPCLLLLLKEQAGYGYDLVARLKLLGIDDDPAAVYRALRSLETQQAVASHWCTSATGPARRMYELTPVGEERLQAAVQAVAETHQAIERFFCRHALAQGRVREADEAGPARPAFLRRLVGRAAGP